jgi:HrpA-like RNA helicase
MIPDNGLVIFSTRVANYSLTIGCLDPDVTPVARYDQSRLAL